MFATESYAISRTSQTIYRYSITRREKGSGNTAYNEFYHRNSIIADVARLLTSFTTNAQLLTLRNTSRRQSALIF